LNSTVTGVLSPGDQPGHNEFISGFNSWDWRTTPNDNLWQGVNGINNPCPSGYRLPTVAEFNSEAISWGTNVALNAYNSLKLVLGGQRSGNNSGYVYTGGIGIYWTSNISGSSGYSNVIEFNGNTFGSDINQREVGCSVRCIKD
jgi:hypothetical protein